MAGKTGLDMRMWGVFRWLPIALVVSACAQNEHHLTTVYLDRFASGDPAPGEFMVCHGFKCVERKQVSLSQDQWRRVTALFAPRANNAPQERQHIARAVAMVETFVG